MNNGQLLMELLCFRDHLIAASLKGFQARPEAAAPWPFPRSYDRGLIEGRDFRGIEEMSFAVSAII